MTNEITNWAKDEANKAAGVENLNDVIEAFVNNVRTDICENYCKYSCQYRKEDADLVRLWEEKCDDCPLMLL